MFVPNPKLFTILIFLAAYALVILFYHHKTIIVWGAAVVLIALRLLGPLEALRAIDWNVVMLYFGMLLVSEVFLFSRMPDNLATLFAARAKNVGSAMVLLCLFTGLLSVTLENVAVVLLVGAIWGGIAWRDRRLAGRLSAAIGLLDPRSPPTASRRGPANASSRTRESASPPRRRSRPALVRRWIAASRPGHDADATAWKTSQATRPTLSACRA